MAARAKVAGNSFRRTGNIGAARRPSGDRVRKTMEISQEKLAKARHILGSESDTQTVDRALDMIIANQEIAGAIEAAFGSMPDFKAG